MDSIKSLLAGIGREPGWCRCVWAILFFFVTAPSFAQDTTAPASDAQPLVLANGEKSAVIQLSRQGAHLLVHGIVNGKDAGWFAVDTGCSGLTIDTEVAGRLHLPLLGKFTSKDLPADGNYSIARLDSFAIGSVSASKPIACVVDLSPTSWAGGVRLAGIVGCDFLARLPFTIDFRHSQLTFYDRAAFTTPAVQACDIEISDGCPAVRGSIEGHEALFLIDTGAGSMSLNLDFIKAHKDLSRRKHLITDSTLDIGGKEDVYTTWLTSITFMDRTRSDVEADFSALGGSRVSPEFPDLRGTQRVKLGSEISALLPASEFSNARLTMNFAEKKLWVEWQKRQALKDYLARLEDQSKNSNANGETPLMLAALAGRADAVAELLRRPVEIDTTDQAGYTALICAIDGGSAECIRAILNRHANPNMQVIWEANTALHLASMGGDAEAVRLLLAGGAQVDLKNTLNRTALHFAVEGDWPDVASALLDAHARASVLDKRGKNPLMLAAQNNDVSMAKLLIAHGADINQADANGLTALTYAACGRHEMVRFLLQAGAVANPPADAVTTPLHLAAGDDDPASAVLLLKAGADIHRKDKDGKTPIDMAVSNGSLNVLPILLEGKEGRSIRDELPVR